MDLSDPLTAVIPSLEGQVLRVLAGTTAPMTAATIARLVRRGSEPGVRLALRRLSSVGTVLEDRVGNQYEYRANRDHVAWPAIESVVDYGTAFSARLDAEIARLVESALAAQPEGSAVVTCAMFGSVARGTATADSDIDLVLVVPTDTSLDASSALAGELSAGVERLTGNPVNLMVLSTRQLSEMVTRDDPLVRSWRDDARTVYGAPLLPNTKAA